MVFQLLLGRLARSRKYMLGAAFLRILILHSKLLLHFPWVSMPLRTGLVGMG